MKNIPISIQILAKKLVAFQLNEENMYKSGNSENFKSFNGKIIFVSDKLRDPISKLAGNEGFNLLLSRSLALSKAKIEWINSVNVLADGTLDGFEFAAKHQNEQSVEHARITLAMELLQLMVIFIGEPLMIVLLKDAWPSINNLGSGNKS